jgi:hypothetical protein
MLLVRMGIPRFGPNDSDENQMDASSQRCATLTMSAATQSVNATAPGSVLQKVNL